MATSHHEGSPTIVKEALACNLPVVSTPVGDVEERLAGVQPSAVVPGDAEAIAESLVKFCLNGSEAMVENGLFTWVSIKRQGRFWLFIDQFLRVGFAHRILVQLDSLPARMGRVKVKEFLKTG